MIVRIIGVEAKTGSFTSPSTGQVIDYNNIYLYGIHSLSKPKDGRLCNGEIPETIKIKNDKDVVRSIFSQEMSGKDYIEMIGKEYNVYYDKNGKPDMINPLPPAGKKGA